ncbi:ABC transporter permease subunit [Orrella sp. JC864]|uniref:amino acid ABC transporter permease n=1 Tax=Orrella sp. JC864 TaxID=3120298 RepID=UPI0012BD584B
MSNWSVVWSARDTFAAGFVSTLVLFVLSAAAASALGCLLVYALEGRDNPARRLLRAGIDAMRMLPFLIFAYLLYYGLPAFGLRLTAWQAGLAGLSLYHAAYLAEILRGARLTLAPGSLEAAYAHGYTRGRAFVRIVLPQLAMRTRGVLGNQYIMCLKDTAFLSIITVAELTAAANAVQSRYFIPVEAFVVAIALYWIIGAAIEALVRLARQPGVKRGIEHE